MDSGYYVCGVFIDLEQAFDTVNHEILCEKLTYYGLRGKINDLIRSYLNNRNQFVSINGTDSKVQKITCGVPQGSSLGPLLFLIFINDFRRSCPYFKFTLYADDSTLYCNLNEIDPTLINLTISRELNNVINGYQ